MPQVVAQTAPSSVNILIIEDNEGDAFLIQSMLEKGSSLTFSVLHVPTLEHAEPEYKNKAFNVLLLDLNLPGTTGMEAIEKVRRDLPGMPLIVMTGLDDEGKALGAIQRGAQDYIVKGRYENNILPRAIRYAIERKEFENKVIELAHFDHITGLINRNMFMEELEGAIIRSKQDDSDLAVLLLSLRRFRDVTATLGPDAGDTLLKEVGGQLKSCLPHKDRIARLEGDEFAILVTGRLASPESLVELSAQLLEAIEQPFEIEGEQVQIGGSIGIATYPACGEDRKELISHAETALHRARQSSSNVFQFYTEKLNEELSGRITLEKELRQAIWEKQLVTHYQPIVDLKTGLPYGIETLVRWQHPEKGMIPPNVFIPLAEKSDLIMSISKQIMQMACEDFRDWKDSLEYVALNFSTRDFQQKDFSQHLKAMCKQLDMNPKQLALEVTEGALMEDPKQAIQTLHECRRMGTSIFIDDFGTGYSSLSYLSKLPLDILKIDRSFVADMLTNGHNLIIVTATINLAHALGFKVVAEGVETKEQSDLLRMIGCDKAQGYYFAKPMPRDALTSWLKTYKATC